MTDQRGELTPYNTCGISDLLFEKLAEVEEANDSHLTVEEMIDSQEGEAISSTIPPPVHDMGQYTGDKTVIFVGTL